MRGPFDEDDLNEENDLVADRDDDDEDIDNSRKNEEAEVDYFYRDDCDDDLDQW